LHHLILSGDTFYQCKRRCLLDQSVGQKQSEHYPELADNQDKTVIL
jgi:hypothetical protein